MTKRNVYMCQVNNKYGNNVFLPYSTGILTSFCLTIDQIKENYEFKDNFFLKNDTDEVVAKLDSPEIFGFSSYIWNFEYNKKLAEKVKSKFSNCLIVFGGHQIPSEKEDFLRKHSYIDILVHGDGELPFSEILIKHLSADKDFTGINNLSINNNGKIVKTEIVKGGCDISQIPSPYLMGIFDEIIKTPYSFTASLETNRGCPYECAYCDWGSPLMNSKKLASFDEQRVRDEIEWFGKNKIEFVFGCDSNFGILPRDNGFVDKFIEVKNKYGYPVKFRTAYAKNSTKAIFGMNKKLNDSKMCKGVTLSFQSLYPKTLEAIGRINMRIDNFKELLQQYNNEGIPTYTEIIMALPYETYDTFCQGLSILLENGQHSSVNIYNCEVFPNSTMGDPKYREYYGIKTVSIPASLPHSVPDKNTVQEFEDIVVETKSMPLNDWKKAWVFSWAIQCFHCLGLTQYISIFARYGYEIPFIRFYKDLINYGENNPNSIIGQELRSVSATIDGVTRGGSWEVMADKFGDITWTVEEKSFLNIIDNKEKFYNEIENYLKVYLKETAEDVISDLVKYTAKMIIDPYCRSSIEAEFNYDFHKYFNEFYRGANLSPLLKKKNKLIFSDIDEFGGDLPLYAREIIWYGRKGGRFFHSQNKIKKEFLI